MGFHRASSSVARVQTLGVIVVCLCVSVCVAVRAVLLFRVGVRCLGGGRLEVRDQIGALSGLLQAGEDHLGSGDVLLGVFQVLEQGVLVPRDALGLVGVGVGESGGLAGLAAHQTVQVRADLVLATGLDGVALRATLDEQLLALLNISGRDTHFIWLVL